MSDEHYSQISYGKMRVPVYRVYATPLSAIAPIPESSFTGRTNILFAFEVDVEVFGNNFLPAYTHGDNSNVVATDSMKNFVLREALEYEGATIEGYLAQLGQHFLDTYDNMERLRLTAHELPFEAAQVPRDGAFTASEELFSQGNDDFAYATLSFAHENGQVMISEQRSGQLQMHLFKVTGSSFTSFVRDEYTTLPERRDRPLFIYLDVYWKYNAIDDLLAEDHARYVPAEQVRDLVATVFHEFVSESIQHLVYEMGQRLLARFPQLIEVTFEGQNRTRDPMFAEQNDERRKVYSDPFSAYGLIKLTLGRADVTPS